MVIRFSNLCFSGLALPSSVACIRPVRWFASGCSGCARRGELGPYAELHSSRSAFVSTKVRRVPVDRLAEIRDDQRGINPFAPGRQLEHAHSSLRVKPYTRHIPWYPLQTVLLVVWRAGSEGKIIVKIFVSMAAADGNAVPVLLTHMKNVIPCGAVPYDPATAAQPACTSVVLLENRVVEYKHKHRASPIDSP